MQNMRFLLVLIMFLLSTQIVVAADFVGAQVCKACHQQEYQLWQGSHHDWAMKPADKNTVLGNFDDVSFDHYGEKTRLSKRGDDFLVTTDNAKGQQQTFKVAYTFGVYPLQQYLLPMKDGRLQALSVSWDSRPEAQGGQRWFHLYPDEAISFDDPLHWSGPYQTWNSRCADCHSTNLQRNYNAADNTYDTQWSEVNVSCEACHGPASEHLNWSKKPDIAGLKNRGFDRNLAVASSWSFNASQATAIGKQVGQGEQLASCGNCHARRSPIANQNLPGSFDQKHQLQLIQAPLYHGDGQILDEVYVLGSFLQSKMHDKGVVCSNCHEPHSLTLRAQGNALCSQCHNPQVFDQPEHHHHLPDASGSQCVNCHMPETTYMVVDPRRDHSLRIPRPDQSVSHGTPNACNQCHQDKDAKWAEAALTTWLPNPPKTHFSDVLLQGLGGGFNAQQQLKKLAMSNQVPALVQASAVLALGNHFDRQSFQVAQTQLANSDAMVRAAAVRLLEALPPRQRWQLLTPLLADTSKQVRIEIVRQLQGAASANLTAAQKSRWQQLQQEYQGVLAMHADTPNGQMNIGLSLLALGDEAGAEQAYKAALQFNSSHLGAYLNLADLYRISQQDKKALAILQQGLGKLPEVAALHHSLGLLLVRQRLHAKAVAVLAKAASLEPDNQRYGYTYGLLLQQQGQLLAAQNEWLRMLKRYPQDRELLVALLSLARQQQQWPKAVDYTKRLLLITPSDQGLQQLLTQLQKQNR